jgi:uncharacterized protein YkwD
VIGMSAEAALPETVMRVVAVVVLSSLLAGCSLGSVPLPMGLAEDDTVATTEVGETSLSAAGTVEGAEPRRKRKSSSEGGWAAAIANLTGSKASSGAPTPPPAEEPAPFDPVAALGMINEYRQSQRLKPLRLDPQLTQAAKRHSRDLARHDRISHYGSDGSSPWDRVVKSGYPARVAAENVGTGQASFTEVLAGWKASEGHNRNLLMSDATHMGLALVRDDATEFKTFWTLVVGAPK